MFNLPLTYYNQKTKFFLNLIFLFSLSNFQTSADEQHNSKNYVWQPQYYGKIKGENKLLHTRSFSHSQLRFVDIDNDGDDDLFVGKKDGRVAFFINQGNNLKPLLKLETEDLSVIHEGFDELGNPSMMSKILDIGKNSAPEFVDIDNDKDLDLFIGSRDGQIFHYENKGNQLKPVFFRKTPIYMGLKFEKNSIPRFADLNGDNKFDLIVGTGSGKIIIFFNSGTVEEAIFCPKFNINDPPDIRCKFQPQNVDNIAPLINAVPEIVDWDKDKDLDLVVGKSNGKLNFYINKGDRFSPKWELKSKNFQFINEGGNVAPTFHDINSDNYPELFLGTNSSYVKFYENREVLFDRLGKLKKIKLENIDPSFSVKKTLSKACEQLNGFPECLNSIASAFDIPKEIKIKNFDEILPYIFIQDPSFFNGMDMGNPEGTQLEDLSKNKKHDSEKILSRNRLWLNNHNFLNIEKLGGNILFSSITSGDWNNDGNLDILIGSKSGEIFAFENRSDNNFDWYQINFPALKKNNRSFSYPYLVDIDGDKDLDIICGNKQGKIEWIINQGTQNLPDWRIHELNLSQIDVGSHSAPLLEDMDNDDDFDMLVGNSKGLIIYFENEGKNNLPYYVLRSTRITGLQLKANSTPAFWKWNEDKHPDLFVGNREGSISLITHSPPENSPIFRGWNLHNSKWQNIKNIGNSAPHFADFDKDNKTDLMMGDMQGNLIFWKNKGLKKSERFKKGKNLELAKNSLEVENKKNEENEENENITTSDTSLKNKENLESETFVPKFELVSKKFGNLDLGRRSFPAFMDIDGDGNIDLVSGNKSGELRYYRQNKTFNDTNWSLESTHFLGYNGVGNSAPVFTDLDGDNDKDLLVGNREGSIYYWENKGNFDLADFVYNPKPFIGVTGGRNSVPAVLDLNHDGFNDIIIGNLLGQLYKYDRENTNNGFRFRLERRKYLNLDVGLGAVPKLADIDNDNQPELIIGSDSGNLFSFKIKNKKDSEIEWEKTSEYFKSLKLPIGGNPVFVDIDTDGDLDMIIGTEKGTLYHYRNTGY
tara:strand:+ start:1352 stop:4483 length:3132 start_codon:yes stop_codon:yes gene_type:complete